MVCFLNLKIVALEATIPKQSRKMVKFKMASKVWAKNKMSKQVRVNTVSETTKTPFFSFCFEKILGIVPSSLMAYMTLGLLINSAFT